MRQWLDSGSFSEDKGKGSLKSWKAEKGADNLQLRSQHYKKLLNSGLKYQRWSLMTKNWFKPPTDSVSESVLTLVSQQ